MKLTIKTTEWIRNGVNDLLTIYSIQYMFVIGVLKLLVDLVKILKFTLTSLTCCDQIT